MSLKFGNRTLLTPMSYAAFREANASRRPGRRFASSSKRLFSLGSRYRAGGLYSLFNGSRRFSVMSKPNTNLLMSPLRFWTVIVRLVLPAAGGGRSSAMRSDWRQAANSALFPSLATVTWICALRMPCRHATIMRGRPAAYWAAHG
jgi:hypothetical protein